jgi:hypothetical protein
MTEIPPASPAPPTKKGLPALGWIGIGCGTLTLIGAVVLVLLIGFCKRKVGEFTRNPEKAAAELMVRMNPNLTKVSQDDAKGEMTLRTKDGQEMTMSYKDISQGKFTLKDAKGNVARIGQADLAELPAWVPRVPKAESTTGSFQNQAAGKLSGLYTATTAESISGVEQFFKTAAAKLAMTETDRVAVISDGIESRTLTYDGHGRQLNIVITGKPGETVQVNVGYSEAK